MLLWITHSTYAIFSLIIQKYFTEFIFTVTSRTLIKYHPPPLFTTVENYEKCVDPPTPRAWRNYGIAPGNYAVHHSYISSFINCGIQHTARLRVLVVTFKRFMNENVNDIETVTKLPCITGENFENHKANTKTKR